MPPKKKKKVKCWTKPKKEGGTYTTCKGFQDGDKKKKPPPKITITEDTTKKEEKKPEVKSQLPKLKEKPVKLRVAPKPKKAKPVAKPKLKGELGKFGLTKKEAKKMDPAKLFGMLPKELRQNILNPKITGVKVGAPPLTQTQLRELDKIVDELVGADYYFNVLSTISAVFLDPKKYIDTQEKRSWGYGRATSKAQEKLFGGKKLSGYLKKMDKSGMLKGYEYLDGSFKGDKLSDAIDDMASDREDYSLMENLGVDELWDGQLYIATGRTKEKLKDYVDEYKGLKDQVIKKMKDFKL